MKVKLEEGYRDLYTLNEVQVARQVIKEVAADDETAAGWASYAAREALKDTKLYVEEVVKASAVTARNCRAWDSYFVVSGHMDVWVRALVKTSEGYMECSAYLTDIWQTGGEDYRAHMWVRRFKEVQ